MENRRKFYSSCRDPQMTLWSNDTLPQRYDHIKGVMNSYFSGILNKEDLLFAIKNAFVSKIYISVDAKKVLDTKNLGNLQNLYNHLVEYGVLDLQDKIHTKHSSVLSPYFDICKLGDRKLGVSIEHVVPGNVYVDDALNGSFDFKRFQDIFNNVSICIVACTQARDLDKKLRNMMPIDKTTNQPIDYKLKPFARYDDKLNGNNVLIHNQTIVGGTII